MFAQCAYHVLQNSSPAEALATINRRTKWFKTCDGAMIREKFGLLQFSEEFADAADSFIDVLFGYGIRDADVFGGTERLAGDGDDVSLMKQPGCELGGRLDAAFADEGADVGVDVECSLRLGAGKAGDLRQLGEHVVAKLDKLGAEFADTFLRACKRGDGGLLHHAGCIRCGLRLQLAQVGYHRL